jgi:hypothetical protein
MLELSQNRRAGSPPILPQNVVCRRNPSIAVLRSLPDRHAHNRFSCVVNRPPKSGSGTHGAPIGEPGPRATAGRVKGKKARPRLRSLDRLFWVLLSRHRPAGRKALAIIKPATVISWHCRGFRLFWTWKSRSRPYRWWKFGSRSSARKPKFQRELVAVEVDLAHHRVASF